MNYSREFKDEVLKLFDEIGIKKAAEQLGLKYYTLAEVDAKATVFPIVNSINSNEGEKALMEFIQSHLEE